MSYPKPAYLKCPDCLGWLIWDTWTHTTADSTGEPEERSGIALYCQNKECVHNCDPVDEDDAISE